MKCRITFKAEEPMANNAQLAKIHIAKKYFIDSGLWNSDEDYKEYIFSNYNVKSSSKLSYYQAESLLDEFKEMGWKPKPSNTKRKKSFKEKTFGTGKEKYDNLGIRKGFANPKELRKIEGLWRDVARDKSDKALSNFIKNKTGLNDITFLKKRQASNIIIALKKMKESKI